MLFCYAVPDARKLFCPADIDFSGTESCFVRVVRWKVEKPKMMKSNIRTRALTALFLTLCLVGAPLTAFAKKGEKNFKKGLEYESAQQWEKAAEEFTLAMAALPSDAEYQLHYRRSLFNASQVLMQRGRALMESKDYIGAYNAFRQSYAYDQINELAHSEMARALRMQSAREQERENANGSTPANGNPSGGVQVRPTSFQPDAARTRQTGSKVVKVSTRAEELRSFDYSNQDLKFIIRKLADDLGLNVIFDPDTFRQQRNIDLHLKNVTTGQVLDYVFLQEGLFFQKLSRRTIMVANQTRRAQFQQLVLRTFYLSNVEPEAARALIQQAIPPNQGRPSTIALVDKGSNSLTVRDTSENIQLIENLIRSIDKDRAEVVMEVQIYEVSRNDVLQIGNQIGDSGGFSLGGSPGLAVVSARPQVSQIGSIVGGIPTAIASALVIPKNTLTAFQSKGNTKLLASTQIHAFNGEESQARIGQRVPVQTAQTFPFGGFNNGNNNNNNGNALGGGGGFPVIQYEPVGLTLKFTPTVYPNQDVQVKMNIESKDVGGSSLTPTFTERTISGTARIQNNRTMLLASVAQNRTSDGRAGLPLVSFLPVLGRLFSAPRKSNDQVDIVIAVTPRVLRAPAITPEDEQERDSGTLQMPTTGTIAQVVEQAENEEAQLALANRPTEAPALVNVSAAPAVDYVPAARPNTVASATVAPPDIVIETTSNKPAASLPATESRVTAAVAPAQMQPVSMPAAAPPALNIQQAVQQLVNGEKAVNTSAPAKRPENEPERNHATIAQPLAKAAPVTGIAEANAQAMAPTVKPKGTNMVVASAAQLSLMAGMSELHVGMKQRIAITLETETPMQSVMVALKFDPMKIKITGLTQGNAGNGTGTELMQRIRPSGEISVMVTPEDNGTIKAGATVLFYLEVTALEAGHNALDFDRSGIRLMTNQNTDAFVRFADSALVVKP